MIFFLPDSNVRFDCMATFVKFGRAGLVIPTPATGCKCLKVQTTRGPTLLLKRAFRTTRHARKEAKAPEPIVGIPYKSLSIGVPKESFNGTYK